jgi:hypothetical protein
MPRRRRDYKAEYERRIAKGAAAGKSRQLARGHKVKEHLERREQTIAKYGVSPSQLTSLRKLARAHVVATLEPIAKAPISERQLRAGLRLLSGADLQRVLGWSGIEMLSVLHIDDQHLPALAGYFPESMDYILDERINPLWYKGRRG